MIVMEKACMSCPARRRFNDWFTLHSQDRDPRAPVTEPPPKCPNRNCEKTGKAPVREEART